MFVRKDENKGKRGRGWPLLKNAGKYLVQGFEVKKVYLDLITIFNIMGNQYDQIGQFIGLWATF